MTPDIILKQDGQEKPSQKEVVDQLLSIIPADKIYLQDKHLLIIVSEKVSRSLQQYKVILDGSGWNHKGYYYTLFNPVDVVNGITEGELFYTIAFASYNLIRDSGRSVIPVPIPLRVANVYHNSESEFGHSYIRSSSFFEGAKSFVQREEYEVAAFMLHQSVELLLRGFLIAISSREIKTHSLMEIWPPCRRYIPELQQIYPPDSTVDKALWLKLDQAYVNSRYSLHYSFSSEHIHKLIEKSELLMHVVKAAIQKALKEYRDMGEQA